MANGCKIDVYKKIGEYNTARGIKESSTFKKLKKGTEIDPWQLKEMKNIKIKIS